MADAVELAVTYVQVVPSLQGAQGAIASDLIGAVQPAADESGKRAGRSIKDRMVSGVKGAGAAMLAGFGIHALVDGFITVTGKASDLNETVNKAGVIFGDQFGQIDSWSRGSAEALGLSREAALNAAAGFGDMFSQLGFSSRAAAEMSTQVVQMSADLGSFNNMPTAEVADRISAAFRGEYDSLQTLIPNINAARVEQEAMAMTGKTNADQLTAQERAAAVLAIVNKDGARAMGDFARTADGAANSQKINAARMEDLQARAGGVLAPLQALAIDGFGQLLTAIDQMMPSIEGFAAWLGANQWVFGALATVIGIALVAAFTAWAVSIWTTTVALLANPVTWIILGIVALGVALVALIANWDSVAAWLGSVWNATVQGVLAGWNAIVAGAVWLGNTITGAFSSAWQAIVSTVTGAASAVVGFLAGVWQRISSTATAAWNGIVAFVASIPARILAGLALLASLGARAAEWFGQVREAAVRKFGEAVDWIKGVPGRILSALGNMGNLLRNAGQSIIDGFLRGLRDSWGKVTDFVGGIADWIARNKGPLTYDYQLLQPAGRTIMRGLADSLQGEIPGLEATLNGVTATIASTPVSAASASVAGTTYTFGDVILDVHDLEGLRSIEDFIDEVRRKARQLTGV